MSMTTETIWANLAESIRLEKDGTTIPVPVEDIRALLEERYTSADEREALAKKATTPDGRLEYHLLEGETVTMYPYWAADLRTVIAGFRRSEPSAECPKCGVRVTDQTPSTFYTHHDESCLGTLDEPQGEPSDGQVDEYIARAFAESDDRNHEDLCSCGAWPDTCVTYGDRKPWSHDAEFVARAAVRAALSLREGGAR